ncbi:MAG: hypothetical protein Q9186_005683 [Xanthomendoza sp. 1 TL-2023]
MHVSKILALTGLGLLSPLTLAATPPSTCQYKVFVDTYANAGCAVVKAGDLINLTRFFYLAPGECKDAPQSVASFRNAISNDAKAGSCTLTAYDTEGCKGKAFNQQPNKEAAANQCVDYSLSSSGNLLGAKSFSLKCK